jgi:hypothetical protein
MLQGMSLRATRLAPFVAVLAVALLATALGGSTATGGSGMPNPDGGTAKTNKGGSCRLDSTALRAGGAITFGGKISRCTTRFGIRNVVARSILYEGINTALTVADTGRVRGGIPYDLTASYEGTPEDVYESRFDVTVVIKGGKSKTKPRKPEKWKSPSKGCRVMTTNRSGDTLGCIFGNELPPG